MGLLACSKGGLSETELQYLLSDDLTDNVPMMVWAEVRRTLKAFLRNIAGRGEQERLDFFHASIQEVSKLIFHKISLKRNKERKVLSVEGSAYKIPCWRLREALADSFRDENAMFSFALL